MDEMNLKDRLADIYYQFMTDMHIGKYSGIFYGDPPVKKRKKKKKGTESEDWRFASMPYVGKFYNSAQTKILFIGLDMGKDINKNRYLGFDGRHNTILRIDKDKRIQQQDQEQILDYNPHVAGTYAVALAILSKYNEKWGSEWYDLSHDKYVNKKTTKTLVNNYPKKQTEDNVLEYVGLTNLFKFVTVDRDKAQGEGNRHWINKKLEMDLLAKEIEIFNPDIIVLQGSGRYMYIQKSKGKKKGHEKNKETFNFFDYCKQNGIIVIKGKHPAYAKDGWNKISGVENLLKKYNLLPEIDN